MGLRLIKDFTLFLLIFSFINDNFLVELGGEMILKAIFGLFIIVNIDDIVRAFVRPANKVMKSFFVFIAIMAIVMLITKVFFFHSTLTAGLLVLVPMTLVFAYFSYYQNFERLLYFIWISVVVSAIISLFNDPVSQWTFRRSGGTMDPNEFSAHLLGAIGITVYLFYKNKNILFLSGSMALFGYTLLYAGSKSAMLTLALLGLYAIFVKFGFIMRKVFSFKGLIAFALVVVVAIQFDFSKVEAVTGMQERAQAHGTADTRYVSWQAGWRMAQDNFLIGVGFDVYEDYARGYATDFIADGSLAPHNIFVKLLAEAGIFSFAAFIAFLYFLFSTKYLQVLQGQYFWISLVAFSNILMGLTLSSTYEKYFWMFLALLANVVIILYKNQREENSEDTSYIA
ncbi:MAG: O-antigen ligase family protein [Epsilonproteobacteria bacterium]|nr:O-antigen ligase family protein [Campylobacterota bacterium]